MIVAVTPDVRLVVESGETVIERRLVAEKGKRAGEERWVFLGSYADPAQAAGALLGRHLPLVVAHPEAVADLRALLDEVREVGDLLAAALTPLAPATEPDHAFDASAGGFQ